MPDDLSQKVEGALRAVQAPNEIKSQAWQGFFAANTPEEFRSKFDGLDLPKQAKAALWQLKFPQASPAPPESTKALQPPALSSPSPASPKPQDDGTPWYDRPMIPVSKMIPSSKGQYTPVRGAAGLVRGIAEGAESMTTPANAAMMAGIAGAEMIPFVGPAVRIGAGAMFTAEMAGSIVKSIPEAKKAWDKGDWDKLGSIVGKDVVQALFVGSGSKHLREHIRGSAKPAAAAVEAKPAAAPPTPPPPPSVPRSIPPPEIFRPEAPQAPWRGQVDQGATAKSRPFYYSPEESEGALGERVAAREEVKLPGERKAPARTLETKEPPAPAAARPTVGPQEPVKPSDQFVLRQSFMGQPAGTRIVYAGQDADRSVMIGFLNERGEVVGGSKVPVQDPSLLARIGTRSPSIEIKTPNPPGGPAASAPSPALSTPQQVKPAPATPAPAAASTAPPAPAPPVAPRVVIPKPVEINPRPAAARPPVQAPAPAPVAAAPVAAAPAPKPVPVPAAASGSPIRPPVRPTAAPQAEVVPEGVDQAFIDERISRTVEQILKAEKEGRKAEVATLRRRLARLEGGSERVPKSPPPPGPVSTTAAPPVPEGTPVPQARSTQPQPPGPVARKSTRIKPAPPAGPSDAPTAAAPDAAEVPQAFLEDVKKMNFDYDSMSPEIQQKALAMWKKNQAAAPADSPTVGQEPAAIPAGQAAPTPAVSSAVESVFQYRDRGLKQVTLQAIGKGDKLLGEVPVDLTADTPADIAAKMAQFQGMEKISIGGEQAAKMKLRWMKFVGEEGVKKK